MLSIGVSPYSLMNSSYDLTWLEPYRDLNRTAVNIIEADSRLFYSLASFPARIAISLPPRPESLLINSQKVAINLMYHLGNWWVKKADASLTTSTTQFTGTLPEPLNKVYEQALTSFIGGWSSFSVEYYDTSELSDSIHWDISRSGALAYLSHIESSAKLFLDAVSRGDKTGSEWLLENFLKWWGNHDHSSASENIEYDFRVRDVTTELAYKSWEETQEFLWDGGETITIEFSKMALNLALRQYWETMRLFLIMLLIQKTEQHFKPDSLEIRMAAILIKAEAQKPGGNVSADSIATLDDVLSKFLKVAFGNHLASKRIDQFALNLDWDTKNPEVIGWPYSWSGTSSEIETMKRPLGILLAALASERRERVFKSQELLESWWKDISKLEGIHQNITMLRSDLKEIRTTLSPARDTLDSLLSALGKTHRANGGCIAASLALRKILKVVIFQQRTTLDSKKIDLVRIQELRTKIAETIFNPTLVPPPFKKFEFAPNAIAPTLTRSFEDEKKYYLERLNLGSRAELAKIIGDKIRADFISISLRDQINKTGVKPINTSQLRHSFSSDKNSMKEYIQSIANACTTMISQGIRPIVLVGRSATRTLLNPEIWGEKEWQCPIPQGISIEHPRYPEVNSIALINGIPVYEHLTPNQDCFVVDPKDFKTIVVNGHDTRTALHLAHSAVGRDRLRFIINIQGQFE